MSFKQTAIQTPGQELYNNESHHKRKRKAPRHQGNLRKACHEERKPSKPEELYISNITRNIQRKGPQGFESPRCRLCYYLDLVVPCCLKGKGRENIEKTPENSQEGNGNPHTSQKGNLKHLKTFRKEISHNRHAAPRARIFDRAHASEKVELLLIHTTAIHKIRPLPCSPRAASSPENRRGPKSSTPLTLHDQFFSIDLLI